MKISRKSTLTVLLLASLVACASCAQFGLSKGDAESDVLDLAQLAKEFWLVRVPPGQAEKLPEAPRVAVVEFSVQFVSPPAPEGTKEAPDVDFGSGMKLELPGVLYRGFIETLPEFDRHPVPLSTVSQSRAYGRLRGVGLDDPSFLSAATKDAKANLRYPVDGLKVLAADQDDADKVMVDLLREVEADTAAQVRLRVSVRDGRASIEKGSTFRVVTANGAGELESKLTIISGRSVVDEEPGAAVQAINSSRFVKAIQMLFRPLIGMGLIASGRSG